MNSSRRRKSTIVRAAVPRLLGTLSRPLPSVAASLAARLWFAIPPRIRSATVGRAGQPFTVELAGRAVRGSVWGEGPLVYLVHGWAGDSQQMGPLVEPLVAAGHRVVALDGPSHGRSDPGPSGPARSHAVEFADAVAAVAARFGPARAVVAHSMGAMATMLARQRGQLVVERLVFVAPMPELRSYLDLFATQLNLSRRARRQLDVSLETRVGMLVDDFELRRLAESEPAPLLVVHDRDDRRVAWTDSAALVDRWPDARLVSTEGLGHNRLLADPRVHAEVVGFVSR